MSDSKYTLLVMKALTPVLGLQIPSMCFPCVGIFPASDEMIKFWTELPNATVDDNFLALSLGSYFLGAI